MININVTDNGEVYANNFLMVNLKNPFRKIIDYEKSKKPASFYEKLPSETLLSKRMMSYYCKIGSNYYGEMYKIYSNSLKYHGVYKLNKRSSLFSARVIDKILNRDHSLVTKKSFNYIDKVINIIKKSLPFDVIFTDFESNNSININWNLIKVNNEYKNDNLLILNTLLKNYKIIPLKILNDVLNYVSIDETDIDLNIFEPYQNIVIISGINGFYASFLTDLIKNKYSNKEILPVSLFVLGK